MNQTISQRIESLVSQGATIARPGSEDAVAFFTIRFTGRPSAYYFNYVTPWAEDQSGLHGFEFESARQNGPYVEFEQGGQVVATLAPFEPGQALEWSWAAWELESDWKRRLEEMLHA